jgi:pimeloyl-ACP methyl ester carboxylesterase
MSRRHRKRTLAETRPEERITMAIQTTKTERGGTYVHANGIDIHYVEAGAGEPLLLLHGGVVSTGPLWAGHPFAYVDHMQTLAARFRVIAPDTRGAGATVHGDGAVSFALLADDVLALIEALDLDRPMICGFSEGGITATVLGIRSPDSVRAIVNHAGYDVFNPQAPTFAMLRMMLGGSPEATEADPDVAERSFGASEEMRATFELLKADHDDAQGPGYWRTYLRSVFPRLSRSPGYTFDDLRSVTAPTLVLTGDRDHFCSVEEGVTAYRMLQHGELAVLANHGHVITPAAVNATIEFLERHETANSGS